MNTLPPYAQSRNLPRTPGIYAIRNIQNQHCYIGSAINLYRRHGEHARTLLKGQHKNRHLQNAYNTYGEAAFVFEVIELVGRKEDLLLREQHYLDTLCPAYNLSPTAGNTLGVKFSNETRAKLVEKRSQWTPSPESIARGVATRTGMKMPKEFGEAVSARQRGRVFSDESRARMSASATGRKATDEARAKMGQARTGLQRSSEAIAKTAAWHTGRKRSDEARAHMSEAQKNRSPISDETRAKLSAAGKGRSMSEEARRKSSEAQKGRVFSEETRRKMSIAAKNRKKRE